MEQTEHDKILAFDTLFTNNRIQMLKILMSYFDAPMQKHFAIYIKYMELQYTMEYFKTASCPPFPKETEVDMEKMCREIVPYCPPSERKRIEQLCGTFSTINNYKEMMETVSMMKEMFPEGEGGGFSPEMLSGMLGPDAAQMFEMFSAMSQAQEGDNNNGQQTGMDE